MDLNLINKIRLETNEELDILRPEIKDKFKRGMSDIFSQPPNPNDLGNGVYLTCKDPWDLWTQTEDAEFEIVSPKQLPQ